MQVNGYKLREALRRWTLRRDTATGQFPQVLSAFPNEDKPDPKTVAANVLTAETAIAKLQTAQTIYNSRVMLRIHNEPVSLLGCIKRVGGLGRIEKMWRTAATVKADRYSYGAETRKADEMVAVRRVTYEAASDMAAQYSRVLAEAREAIATGNAQMVDIEDLDPALFE